MPAAGLAMRLELYLGRQLLKGYWTATVGLGGLLWLLGFLQQIDQLGNAESSFTGAIWGGLTQVPAQVLQLLPVISIMATAGVLSSLQANREITILRLVGWTPRRLALVALLPLLVVALIGLGLRQWVTPWLAHGAGAAFSNELRDDGLWHDGHGLWLRDGNTLLNVGALQSEGNPADINIFRLDETDRIDAHVHAEYAVVEAANRWLLFNVREWQLQPPGISPVKHPSLEWPSFLSSRQLHLLQRAPEALSFTELASYILAMRRGGQSLAAYELAFWEQLALPFACLGMTLVAVALAGRIQAGRGGGIGWSLAAALGIGLGYLLGAQLVTYGSLLARLPAWFTSLASPSLLVLLGWVLLFRVR